MWRCLGGGANTPTFCIYNKPPPSPPLAKTLVLCVGDTSFVLHQVAPESAWRGCVTLISRRLGRLDASVDDDDRLTPGWRVMTTITMGVHGKCSVGVVKFRHFANCRVGFRTINSN